MMKFFKNNIHLKIFYEIVFIFFIALPNAFAFSCGPERPIIQKPILFDDNRIQLTRDYQRKHYGIDSPSIEINPEIIVLHWTTTATFKAAFDVFYPAVLSDRPELPDHLNVSSHFLVDRDGRIYQLMPLNWMARHVIGLNHVAIGIENVGGVNGREDLTLAQAKSNAFLVCTLKKNFPNIKYLIGHSDYLEFKQSPLWLEKDPNYQIIKSDPGQQFMRKVKSLTKHLKLQHHPVKE